MADEEDRSNKTEDPTQRKLEDAHSKGNVVNSTEVTNWAMIGASTLVIAMFAAAMMRRLANDMMAFLESPHAMPVDSVAVGRLLQHLSIELVKVAAAPVGFLFLAALAVSTLQHKPVWSFEKLKPNLGALSPLKGLKGKFSLRTVLDLVKNLAKLAIVGAAIVYAIWPKRAVLLQVHAIDLAGLLHVLKDLSLQMLIAIVAAMTLIAAADYIYQWWDHQRNLKMSLQDIRDEHKDSEGDPHIKARIRQIRQERQKLRMVAAVPQATVLVTNPTHFAVALKYKPEEKMNAPVVVAKGADLLAKRLREVAEEHKVPIVENPPLARALYASAEVDQEIPVEHYKAVAEVISYVFRLKKKRMPDARKTAARPQPKAQAQPLQ